MDSVTRSHILAALTKEGAPVSAHMLVQSHFDLSDKITTLSALVASSASRRDVDRALAIFSSLVIASLGLFISIH